MGGSTKEVPGGEALAGGGGGAAMLGVSARARGGY